jgi:hypothetical protein
MVDSESLEVDLGAVYRVCAVNVHWGVATALSFEVQVAAPQRWEPEYVRNTNSRASMTSWPPEFDVALFDLALRRKSKASERVLKSTIYSVCVSLFYVIDTGSIGSRARYEMGVTYLPSCTLWFI